MLPKAKPFFEDARSQLESTNHFGVLGSILETDQPHTRADYVSACCKHFLELKKAVPGMGLGSSNWISSTSEEYQLISNWSGVDIAQAWSILLNAGHLFGTFATERALLFHLDRNLDDREVFLRGSVDFFRVERSELRRVVERALNEARLFSFHYLTALWRLRPSGTSNLDDEDRERAQLIVKAFVCPPNDAIRSLKDTFRRVRQLTYMQLHRSLREVKFVVAAADLDRQDLRRLFPTDSLPDADWSARSRWQAIDGINRNHTVDLFGSSSAAAEVLSHLEAFKPWLGEQRARGRSFPNILDNLFLKPEDWSQPGAKRYRSFIGVQVPTRLDWLTETRLWLRDAKQKDPWKGSSFLVTPDPESAPLAIDIYSDDRGLPVSTLRHCTLQLARAFCGGYPFPERRLLWMSAARLAARAFEGSLKPGYAVRLQPTRASEGHVGYATMGESYELARGFVKEFLVSCRDPGREDELRQLLSVTDSMEHWRVPTIIMLARVLIVNTTTNKEVTDIDGLCGFFVGSSLRWVIMECKDAPGGGSRQLRRGIGRCLISDIGRIVKEHHRDLTSWHTIYKSPSRLKRRAA